MLRWKRTNRSLWCLPKGISDPIQIWPTLDRWPFMQADNFSVYWINHKFILHLLMTYHWSQTFPVCPSGIVLKENAARRQESQVARKHYFIKRRVFVLKLRWFDYLSNLFRESLFGSGRKVPCPGRFTISQCLGKGVFERSTSTGSESSSVNSANKASVLTEIDRGIVFLSLEPRAAGKTLKKVKSRV